MARWSGWTLTIELTDDDAERAGRMLAGVISLEDVHAEIRREAGVQRVE